MATIKNPISYRLIPDGFADGKYFFETTVVKGSNLLLALFVSKEVLYNSAYVTSIKNRISRCLVPYNEQGREI